MAPIDPSSRLPAAAAPEARPAPLWRVALLATALYGGLALGSIVLSRQPGSVATLWYASSAGALLLTPRRRQQWPLLLLLMMAVQVAINRGLGDSLPMSLAFVPPNALEIVLGALALQKASHDTEWLSRPAALLRIVLRAGVLPALAGTALGSWLLSLCSDASFAFLWPRWLEGELIGAVSVLPLGLYLLHNGAQTLAKHLRRLESASLLLLAASVTLLVPLTMPFPFVFITLPLTLIALRGGFALTAVSNLMCSVLTGCLISLGLMVAPPTTLSWGHVLFYLPILAVLLPPILLASGMEGYRHGLEALRASERRFRTLYTRTPALMLSFRPDGLVISASELWLKKLGRSESEVLGQPFTAFMAPESLTLIHSLVLPRLLDAGDCHQVPCRWITAQGQSLETRLSAVWERNHRGRHTRALAVIEDVTENHRLASFAAEREFTEVTLHSIGDGVVATDARGLVQYLNPVAEHLLGVPREQLLGRPFDDVVVLQDQDTQARLDSPVRRCLQERRSSGLPGSALLRGAQGQLHPIQDSVSPILGRRGELLGAVMVFQDVREARAMAQRMAHLAHHDALTDLPNRVLLQDRIQQACEHALREGGGFGVMFLDLDHFKNVNDSLGHAAGDELLREMAHRLRSTLRNCDTICRLGGDEFVMLIGDIHAPQDLGQVAEKVLAEVSRPCHVAGRDMAVSVSLGLAVYPEDGQNVEALMKHADAAMYRAKREGRNRYHFFSKALDEAATLRLQIETELRAGLAADQFVLHYQPLVNAITGQVRGAEALVRWQRAPGECIGPLAFVAVAEECGFIVQLGQRVLELACAQLRSWLDAGLPLERLAINISPMQFNASGFSSQLLSTVLAHGIDPHLIELEITESTLMRDPAHALAVLTDFRAAGMKVALDDFGTGYSSLSYLRRFPVDTLKVDRSFVADIHDDPEDRQLVEAILAMARTLCLHVVAEGVENLQQAQLLATMGCDTMQGYLFSQPMPASQMGEWLGAVWPETAPGPAGTAEPLSRMTPSGPAVQNSLAEGAP